MSQPHRSTTAGSAARAAAAPLGAQRRHPADDIALCILDLETLERNMRRDRTHRQFEDLEAEAQRIARAILEPFRGPTARPTAAPLYLSPDRLTAGW